MRLVLTSVDSVSCEYKYVVTFIVHVFKERTSCPEYLRDVCDGQEHPLFSVHVDKDALQFLI